MCDNCSTYKEETFVDRTDDNKEIWHIIERCSKCHEVKADYFKQR
jgi:putative component of membrane protein insertase Oxa1/YidC/SpoIIIJ protein YidD